MKRMIKEEKKKAVEDFGGKLKKRVEDDVKLY